MSNRYKGGVISATPPTTTGGDTGTAPGVWTLEQQMQAQAAGLWPIQPPPVYVEDVFSTWLYTGNASTQTITNGIDLSGKGGLVWVKARSGSSGTSDHILVDTVRGTSSGLRSNTTGAATGSGGFTAFNSNGFSFDSGFGVRNAADTTYASWTFRKQPKFFDCVTYTGTGSDPLTISHNLQSVPGCIIVKCTSTASNWRVHSTALDMTLVLNLTNAGFTPDGLIKNLTSTTFDVNNSADVNSAGATYVAYLFAHDAGGFGPTETDNVISCGSFTTNGSGDASVTLGYEPQWVMWKAASGSYPVDDWMLNDTMRGFSQTNTQLLRANTTAAEISTGASWFKPNATGFSTQSTNALSPTTTYIYIAIRRGPMKTPTDATKVFLPQTRTGTGATATVSNVGFASDLIIGRNIPVTYGVSWAWMDKLRGTTVWLDSSNTGSDGATTVSVTAFGNTGASYGADNVTTCFNYGGASVEQFYFQRAPGFFDEVCYSGNSVAGQTYAHNLTVAPEMIIVKRRNTSGFQWVVYAAPLGASSYVALNLTDAAAGDFMWNATSPTASVFTVSANQNVNNNAGTYVAYLFATCPGVSKVGGYTGTGTTQTINCGFTAGARFVMIKRTDSTGDWYVWDSARGIIPSNDPYLLLNSTAAEVTGTDYVDTTSVGFEITSTAPSAINANGGTFIFLAIA